MRMTFHIAALLGCKLVNTGLGEILTPDLLPISPFAPAEKLSANSGQIALQLEGAAVKFRNFWLGEFLPR